jgi:hypothetical protein
MWLYLRRNILFRVLNLLSIYLLLKLYWNEQINFIVSENHSSNFLKVLYKQLVLKRF